MENRFRKNYFVIMKTIGLLVLIFMGLVWLRNDAMRAVAGFITSAVFLLFAVNKELDGNKIRNAVWIAGEGAMAVVAMFLFPVIGIWFSAIVMLDILEKFQSYFYPLVYILLAVAYRMDLDLKTDFIVITFLIMVYFQHYKIVNWYRDVNRENMQEESKLKSDIEHSNLAHKDEMKQSRLRHENELLEEKGRISQALHDKLGHSINGSLYQLEAAKLLMDKDKEQSGKILQEVIDNLRGSMDEIRVIIRNERPDKKRMALSSIQTLCNECEEKYGIHTELTVEGEEKQIPEAIWEVILDNTFEAVTNSLKYSGCDTITISVLVLGEVVRATVSDNGKGSAHYEEGMGIAGMKTRVRNVKGYIDIDSQNGFTINMILPLGIKAAEANKGTEEAEDEDGTDTSDHSGRQ